MKTVYHAPIQDFGAGIPEYNKRNVQNMYIVVYILCLKNWLYEPILLNTHKHNGHPCGTNF